MSDDSEKTNHDYATADDVGNLTWDAIDFESVTWKAIVLGDEIIWLWEVKEDEVCDD